MVKFFKDTFKTMTFSEEFPSVAPDAKQDSNVFDSGAKANFNPIGTSGTEIFGGVYSEEYLSKLQSTQAATEFDKMRRSEPQVVMLLSAVMNPIKSANWEIEAGADDEESKKDAELINAVLKEQINWDKFLHEALSILTFGHAVFEKVHNVVENHPKFGTFNGLASLGFRSQKSIYYWHLNKETGKLESVEQIVNSEIGKSGKIPGQFLVVFTLNQEGDNYEGISALRPLYGPYIRKNLYQRLTAIGLEKYAVGTPIGKMPTGKDTASPDYNEFRKALRSYSSHETQFIVVPAGYEIEISHSDFDASKIKEIILMENTEMVNAFVANFLALGTNGNGGAFSLGTDLSDFFLSGIQAYANIIAGELNRNLIPELIKMNKGERAAYPKIKCTGINDKAGKELAEIVNVLTQSGNIKPDMKLEDFLRKSFDLPKAEREAAQPLPAPAPQPQAPMQFSEPMTSREWKAQFKANEATAKEIMTTNLNAIYADIRSQLERAYKNAGDADKVKAFMDVVPKGRVAYQSELKEFLAEIAYKAIQSESKALPKPIKLSETIKLADKPRGGFYKNLPKGAKAVVDVQSLLIPETQINDLMKLTAFQWGSSAPSTESIGVILDDIDKKVLPIINGETTGAVNLQAAAANVVATIENQTRLDFFFEPDVLDQIESFTFTNEDPVSEICQQLNGTTWAVTDPDIDRYGPPLHHNCKSRLVPNYKGDSGNPKVDGTPSINDKALKSITLCEGSSYHLF